MGLLRTRSQAQLNHERVGKRLPPGPAWLLRLPHDPQSFAGCGAYFGDKKNPPGVSRWAMCGREPAPETDSQPTRRFSADVFPRFSISS
jgi:hypothetical protein